MRTAVERLEAQGPSPGPVRLARRTKLGLANPAKEPIARLLAPPGAPFPHVEGKRKKGRRARPGARNQTHGTAERWLLDTAAAIHCRTQRWTVVPSPWQWHCETRKIPKWRLRRGGPFCQQPVR